MADTPDDETGINFANLPPQQGYKIDYRKLQSYDLHPDGVESYDLGEGQPMMDVLSRPLGTNDFHISYIEGEPGSAIPWHTHTPIMQQAYIPIAGRVRVSYKDNDGEVHSTEAEQGEMAYLPAGAHNKIEAVGEERLEMLVVERETLVGRVEQLLEDGSEGVYDPQEDPTYGLEIDSLRGEALHVDEASTEPY